MRDLWTGVPTVRLGSSEWSKNMEALGIIHSLGQWTRGEKDDLRTRARRDLGVNIAGDWFGTFNQGLVGLSQIWAPVVGQMVGGNQILNADSATQVSALTAILTGAAVNRTGGADPVGQVVAKLKSQYMALPYAQRLIQVPPVCAQLIASVNDPAAIARIEAACAELTSKTWWEKMKWPVIISGLTFAGLGLAFVLKPKMFQFGQFSARM